mgnify:CR=1 FL=1
MAGQFPDRALLPAALVQAAAPLVHRLHAGAQPIGGPSVDPLMRAPEQPPGIFFAIWGPIFAAMIGFGLFAFVKRDHVAIRMAPPLTLAAALGTIWMLLEQFAPASPLGFPVLAGLAAAAWWAAARFEAMRGLGGSPAKFMADLASGLLAGWMSVAVAISLPDLIRGPAGLAPTDAVWPMLALVLGFAGVAAWAARRAVTSSPWFTLALAWGLVGLAINNWTLTQLHLPALAAGLAAVLVLRYGFMGAPHAVRART